MKSVNNSVKRIINFVDKNIHSSTYGLSDRNYWSWRTKDFNNGAFQCLIFSIACINNNETFNEIYKKYNQDGVLDKTYDAIKHGSFKELEKTGSSQEAFPNENSFCVTGTLLFDLLSALEISNEIKDLNSNELLILKKAAEFVSNNIETHAKIANHLLAGLASLIKYTNEIDSSNVIVHNGIKNISSNLKKLWHDEGWLEEYGGADIGYLTLSLQYLIEIDNKYFPEKEYWIKSIYNFLTNFFHLDGSIGNFYGSRGSSIIYPSGFLQSSDKEVYEFFIKAYINNKIPIHHDLDDASFVPFINSLIRGITNSNNLNKTQMKPLFNNGSFVKILQDAGFVIVMKENKQTIIDLNKAGMEFSYSYDSKTNTKLKAIRNIKSKKIYCALGSDFKIHDNGKKITINISSQFYEINTEPLKSIELIASRLLIPFFMISPTILKIVKKIAVSKYFSPRRSVGKYNKNIIITDFEIINEENFSFPVKFEEIEGYSHHPIKMASQNYLI